MGKVTKIIRKTASVMIASAMAGSTCYAPVMAAPATGTSQSFSLGRVGTILDSVKDLISGDGNIKVPAEKKHKKVSAFASKRLLVKASNIKYVRDRKHIIAKADGYYLVAYKSKAQAMNAYKKYAKVVYKKNGKKKVAVKPKAFAVPDIALHAAASKKPYLANNGGLKGVTKKSNPLKYLARAKKKITKKKLKSSSKGNAIALLDSGASKSKNVIDRVSMIGNTTNDDYGHGKAMVKAIVKKNKKAKILSIKVLDKRGEGNVSSVVAGIRYAMARRVKIINISLNGYSTSGSTVLSQAISDARNKGIIVVGASGNNGGNVKNYIPGSISGVVVAGACDESGKPLKITNTGASVSYYVKSSSSSEATALTTGYISSHIKKNGEYTFSGDNENIFFDKNSHLLNGHSITPDGKASSSTSSQPQRIVDKKQLAQNIKENQDAIPDEKKHDKVSSLRSNRLIVKEDSKIMDKETEEQLQKETIAQSDDYHLTQYKNENDTKKAFTKYTSMNAVVAPDIAFHAASDQEDYGKIAGMDKFTETGKPKLHSQVSDNEVKTALDKFKKETTSDDGTNAVEVNKASDNIGKASSGGLNNITKDSNPMNELNSEAKNISGDEVSKAKSDKVIALIDSGTSEQDAVIERVSMIGNDPSDDYGHGDAMVKVIKRQNPHAKIISIKALNSAGEGSLSSIVSAIKYAQKRGCSIINLSLSGFAEGGSQVLNQAIGDATAAGIIVVGAAGNDGSDASDYLPGSVSNAIIVGSCGTNGKRISSSNYGSTVDYYVASGSTSEAAATMSGYLSANITDQGTYDLHLTDGGLFFRGGETESELTEKSSNVTIAYTEDFKPDIKVEICKAGTVIETLGKQNDKFAAEKAKTDSIRVTNDKYATGVTYPNGTTQFYTDKNFVISVSKGNAGDYTIFSVDTAEEMKQYGDDNNKPSIFKNPLEIAAVNDRNSNTIFRAQASGTPDHVYGYLLLNGGHRQKSPFRISGIHIDGHPEAIWIGKAYCYDHGAAGPEGTNVRYNITASTKGRKKGRWQYYTVNLHRPGVADPDLSKSSGKGYQRHHAQVAIKTEAPPVSSKVKKEWKHKDAEPVKVRLKKYVAGASKGWQTKEITLSNSNNWTHTESNLDSETDSGKKITYKWFEVSKIKGVQRTVKTTKDGDMTVFTIKNTGQPTGVPSTGGVPVSISKRWLGDEAPNVEIRARLEYVQDNYKSKKQTIDDTHYKWVKGDFISSEKKTKYYTLNDDAWKKEDIIETYVNQSGAREVRDFKWFEDSWRYEGETSWRAGAPTELHWTAGDAGAGYIGAKQGLLNIPTYYTKMVVDKEWKSAETADTIVAELWANTPEGRFSMGTVNLTPANDWHAEIGNLPVYWTRNQNGVLDYHVPAKYVEGEGYSIDEETAATFKVRYEWAENVGASSFQGHNMSASITSSTCTTDYQPEEGNFDDGGSGTLTNESKPTVESDAFGLAGSKVGTLSRNAVGDLVMNVSERVYLKNVAPDKPYTLISGLMNTDGTDASSDFTETTFTPNQLSTLSYSGNTTNLYLDIPMSIICDDGISPAGKKLIVSEELYDYNGELAAQEKDPANERQAIYFPDIKTHMISDNPLNDLAHKYDGDGFDTDGKHYGATAENETDRNITFTDQVTYENLPSGTYAIRGALHRKDRNSATDFGVVAEGDTGWFTISANGAVNGNVNVKYNFNYTDDMFGSDFVSYETLYYVGNGANVAVVDHADLNDKKQTVRMPTRIRIVKKDQETGAPQPHALIGLYTKNANGDLQEYIHNGRHYVLETDNNGVALFCNLDPGEYWFKELKTSQGHNLMAAPFSINAEYYKTREMILGEQTTLMLTTCGSGTTMYYIAAGITAAIVAAAYVIVKRRRDYNN